MPVLSEETFLESGKLFKKNFQSRSLNTCAASSTQCPNFRGLFTSKVTWNYTWNLKPKRWHQKQFGHLFFLRPHSVLRKGRGRGRGGEKEFEIYREGLGKALKELSNVCVSIFSPLERSANFITNTFSFAFHTISFIFLLTLAEKMISRHRLAFSKLMARSKSTVITPFLYICDQKRKDSFDWATF